MTESREPPADRGEEVQPWRPNSPSSPFLPSSAPAASPQYRPQAGYGQPPFAAQSAGTNGFAIASFVLGVVWLWWLGSILALIFGYVAKRQIDRSGGVQGGRGLATAGIVLGWIGVAVLALVILGIAVSAGSSAPDDF